MGETDLGVLDFDRWSRKDGPESTPWFGPVSQGQLLSREMQVLEILTERTGVVYHSSLESILGGGLLEFFDAEWVWCTVIVLEPKPGRDLNVELNE